MVEVLLEMATSDGLAGGERLSRIDLPALLDECWLALDQGECHERRLEREIDPELQLVSDASLLRRILSNLLENSVVYGDPGAPIRFEAYAEETSAILRVSNASSDAPPDVAERAFDAFWRADVSRHAAGRHAGLGLPLCRRIARRLGAVLEAGYVDGRFSMTLTIPESEPQGIVSTELPAEDARKQSTPRP